MAIIFIIIGAVVGAGVIAGLVYWFIIKKRRDKKLDDNYAALRDQKY